MDDMIISERAARLSAWASFAVFAACHPPVQPPRPPIQVVFVCEHGAAKSVVAAAYFNKLARERGLDAHAIARGADPQDQPSVSAVQGLRADGFAATGEVPRSVSVDELRGSARIVAFDCGEPPMKVLRGMGTCWDDVPATGEDYARARDVIRSRVASTVAELIARRDRAAP